MTMTLLTLDFETYYDTKVSLTKMTTMEYVKHPQFKVWGVGIKVDDNPSEWYGADEVADALQQFDWDNCMLLCHNTLFDGYILARYYNITPSYYLDTASMARGMFPGWAATDGPNGCTASPTTGSACRPPTPRKRPRTRSIARCVKSAS